MTFPLLERCFLESTVRDVNGYSYFQNPISDGIPRVDPEVLEEAIDGLAGIMPEDIDLILAPEAMGIPLGAGLSLRTRVPYVVVRKKQYCLPGEIEVLQKTGYSKSRMFVNGLREGMRVVIVDDVLDTGGTLRAVSEAVRRSGAELVRIMVVYSLCEDMEAMGERMGAPVECLVRIGMDGPRPYLRRRARTAPFYHRSRRRRRVDPGLIVLCASMSLAGALLSTFSGLVPGIHVNTLASVLLAMYPAIESALSPFSDPYGAAVAVCCCIMSASVTHSFLDFVPSVFIGAPDSEDCVSVLPGHRLLLQGRGMEAVRAAAIGSLVGTSAAILMSVPLQIAMASGMEGVLDGMTPIAVIGAATVLLVSQFRKGSGLAGTACFVLSGAVGLAVMHLPIPSEGIAGEGTLMFPMLSGLFGVPVLLAAEDGKVPAQKEIRDDPEVAAAGLKGVAMGCVAGWFPGITSTVGASISACFMPENRPERFVATVASIGSVTAVLSLVTLSVSGSGRSGTVLAIGQIAGDAVSGTASEAFLLLLASAAVGSLCGYVLTIKAGEAFSALAGRVDQRRLSTAVLLLTVSLVIVLTGPFGAMVLAVSTLVGFLPGAFGTDRTILCGCLLLPVILMQVRSWRRPSP